MVSRILLADDSITIQKVVNLTFLTKESRWSLCPTARGGGWKADPIWCWPAFSCRAGMAPRALQAIKTDSKFCKVPVVLLVGAFEPLVGLKRDV
jgi:hypothetical protein